MAYSCPRCNGPIQRGRSNTAGVAGGLVGMLFYAAFASFQCESCGKVPMSEFPQEVQSKARLGSAALIAGALLLFVGVIVLLVLLNN